ncbi:hypothetical protein ABAC460_22405 [Asticcacaulis sp. AC460]|uniref:polysaccharide deacetylase family protein n=1 Tax=Asticcacaulis sp. AC460 TaxID=1282360 RepID=UPI0003C3BF51|nr:polysaccharide deacetylase family protein [Asticcacaulis sp. AC460]ESQ86806.1 hypothetical protein ABAC460_22405 [Asticcacaulis sp. AC460]
MKRLVLLALLWLVAFPAAAWPEGKRAAIVLTYDDGLDSQLDVAVPQLDAAGLKGTFFLDGHILNPTRMLRWRAAAANGHELGNHTVYHPCPRDMVPTNDHYATDTYTPQSMVREIGVMNNVLFGIDGKTRRTMAYPCAQTLAGGVDFVNELKASGLVAYVRIGGDWSSVIADPAKLDLFRVPANGPDNEPDGAQLIAYVQHVEAVGGLGVLGFHGTGGDYLKVSAESHQALVTYLRDHPDIWVATFQEVMDYVAANKPLKN